MTRVWSRAARGQKPTATVPNVTRVHAESTRVTKPTAAAGLGLRGAQGIILGCTEIELLITGDDSSVPVFATTRLHVEAAVHASLDRGGDAR